MDRNAKWIVCPSRPLPPMGKVQQSVEFQKVFTVDTLPATALIQICGLGFFDAKLNGQPVTECLLTPPFTAYDKRVYFEEFDILPLLKQGENVLNVQLGGGWYTTSIRDAWMYEMAPWKNTMQLCASLIFDGQCFLNTDSSWQARESRMTESELRGGETYDASLPENEWIPAKIYRGPGGLVQKYEGPGIVIEEILPPVAEHAVEGGKVYDFGVNLAGNCEITVTGPKGSKVNIAYGERVTESGDLDAEHIAIFCWEHEFQTDHYILAGEGEESWHGLFTYHGFRYAKVTGDATVVAIKARSFHTDLPEKGGFECDSEVINSIQAAILRSTKTNYHHMPTDCPHREKNGWTGDAHLSSEQALFNLDMAPAYKKWMTDFIDAQRPSGALPGILPTGGWGFVWGNGISWDCAAVIIPWNTYMATGDLSILEDNYEMMAKYVDYMDTISENGVFTIGLDDWCPTKGSKPIDPASLLTGVAVNVYEIMAKIARATGRDGSLYDAKAAETRKAFNENFLDKAPESMSYLSMLLYFNLTDDREGVTRRLVNEIHEAGDHFYGGIFCNKFLLEALTDAGEFDLAYKVATQRDYPGWFHMLSNGSGTLWEDWEGVSSLNHHMFSPIGAWFYKGIAGIHIEAPGYKKVRIVPHIPADMKFFRAWHDAPMGRLTVEWKDGKLTVTAPEGMGVELETSVPAELVRA